MLTVRQIHCTLTTILLYWCSEARSRYTNHTQLEHTYRCITNYRWSDCGRGWLWCNFFLIQNSFNRVLSFNYKLKASVFSYLTLIKIFRTLEPTRLPACPTTHWGLDFALADDGFFELWEYKVFEYVYIQNYTYSHFHLILFKMELRA